MIVLNIIEEYVNVVSKETDSPKTFITACAYHLVSNMLGRYFYCMEMPYKNKRPNLWYILSSVSGRGRRSTAIAFEQECQKGAMRLLKWDDKSISDSVIEEGTVEGIADDLSRRVTNDTLAIVSSEFGGILKRIRKQRYMSGVMNLLTKLYSGESYKFSLSQRKGIFVRYIPEGLYVTMLTSMQDPEEYLDRSMIRQGTLRRMNIIYEPKSEFWLPPIRFGGSRPENVVGHISEEIAKRMTTYQEILNTSTSIGSRYPEYQFIDIFFERSVAEQINLKAHEIDEKIDINASDINVYNQSIWESRTKMAMCYAIAEGDLKAMTGLSKDPPVIIVKQEHLNKVLEFQNMYLPKLTSVIEGLPEYETKIKSFKAPIERVYSAILEAGEEGMSVSEFGHKYQYWEKKIKDTTIESLKTANRIWEGLRPSATRPAIVYLADIHYKAYVAKYVKPSTASSTATTVVSK